MGNRYSHRVGNGLDDGSRAHDLGHERSTGHRRVGGDHDTRADQAMVLRSGHRDRLGGRQPARAPRRVPGAALRGQGHDPDVRPPEEPGALALEPGLGRTRRAGELRAGRVEPDRARWWDRTRDPRDDLASEQAQEAPEQGWKAALNNLKEL